MIYTNIPDYFKNLQFSNGHFRKNKIIKKKLTHFNTDNYDYFKWLTLFFYLSFFM